MKTEDQIAFIRLKRRFEIDFLDILWFVSVMAGIILMIIAYCVLLSKADSGNEPAYWLLLVFSIALLVLVPFGFINSISFEAVTTGMSKTENKKKVFQFLTSRQLEILQTPCDPFVFVSKLPTPNNFNGQKELTIICEDGTILLNIRKTVGRKLWFFNTDNKRFSKELHQFISRLPVR